MMFSLFPVFNVCFIRVLNACLKIAYSFADMILLSLANSFRVSASPRIVGDTPSSAIASAMTSLEMEISGELFNPFTRVFLLWLKDARIMRNISRSSLTSMGASLYVVSRITALPTFGRGIKQLGGTFATIYGSA